MLEFWRSATRLSRIGLGLAALSAVVLAGTFLGIDGTGGWAALYFIHLAVMAALLAMFVRLVRHHYWSWRRPHVMQLPVQVPRALKLLTFVCLVGLVLLFVVTFHAYGEGGTELRDGRYVWVRDGLAVRELSVSQYRAANAAFLRVFATGWLFFSLLVAWAGQVVTSRLERLRQNPAPELADIA